MDLLDILLGAKFGGGSGGSGGSSTFVPSFGTVASVSLGTTWAGNDPYTSTVTVTGYTVTDKTMVSVLPSTAVLTQMLADGTSNIYITNNNGTLTATALGAAPTQAMTLTVLCSESDQAAAIGALPSIVGDGVIETLQAADLTDAVNKLGTDVSDVKNAISQKAPVIINTASGDIASFADGADDMPIKHLVANIEAVQSGTGDPSPENIRPISGWTGLTGARTGKNLLNLVESEMILSGWNRVFPISIKAGTYIISCQNQIGASLKGASVSLTDENDTEIITALTLGYVFGDTSFVGIAATITEEKAKKIKNIRFAMRSSGTTYGDIASGNIQLEVGSTATAYEPYQGDTVSVSWATEAGTVYGGTLDVVTGKLTVTDAEIASYNGETLPSTWISDRDVYAAGTTPTIGAQVVYKLATPQTYQLDPVTVQTLLGSNTIYVDCGSVTVDYPADTGIVVAEQSNAISQKETKTTYTTLSGTTVTQTGEDHVMYLCGELATLSFTAPQTGITAIRFSSGTTATVVTLTGITMPDDWEGAEANKTYEINVLDGKGVYASWS